jgi:rod shape-determining protein MreC
MMKRSSRRSWLFLTLFIVSLLLLVLHEAGYLAPVENVLHYVVDPLERTLSRWIDSMGGSFSAVREARELRPRVEALQAEVAALTVENVRLREYESEIQQYRALLRFTEEHPVSAFIGADVIGREACYTFPCGEVVGEEPNPYLRYLTANVGALQGAEPGMTVVSEGAGLVGRVATVTARAAKIQLLNDAGSTVAALLQRSRATGLVVGQPDGTLRMEYILQEEDVAVGDVVITSGLGSEAGSLVPKGLVVGQVIQVEQQDYELFQAAIVRPAVDFDRLEVVLVVAAYDSTAVEEAPPGP